MDIKIKIFTNVAEMAEAFARDFVALTAKAIAHRGTAAIALTGGNTPRPLYSRLAGGDYRDAVEWDKVKIFFGDERAVGPDHPDSNFGMARHTWLGLGLIAPCNIYRMEGEARDLDAAARRYEEALRREAPAAVPDGFPVLDLILLGLGEDGHIASLFPGSPALNEAKRAVVMNSVPELGANRLTFTYPTIKAAREVWFLVTGSAKAERVAQILGHIPGGESLPATAVAPAQGKIRWWLDRAAASRLHANDPAPRE